MCLLYVGTKTSHARRQQYNLLHNVRPQYPDLGGVRIAKRSWFQVLGILLILLNTSPRQIVPCLRVDTLCIYNMVLAGRRLSGCTVAEEVYKVRVRRKYYISSG